MASLQSSEKSYRVIRTGVNGREKQFKFDGSFHPGAQSSDQRSKNRKRRNRQRMKKKKATVNTGRLKRSVENSSSTDFRQKKRQRTNVQTQEKLRKKRVSKFRSEIVKQGTARTDEQLRDAVRVARFGDTVDVPTALANLRKIPGIGAKGESVVLTRLSGMKHSNRANLMGASNVKCDGITACPKDPHLSMCDMTCSNKLCCNGHKTYEIKSADLSHVKEGNVELLFNHKNFDCGSTQIIVVIFDRLGGYKMYYMSSEKFKKNAHRWIWDHVHPKVKLRIPLSELRQF